MLRFIVPVLACAVIACGSDDKKNSPAPQPVGSSAADVDESLYGIWKMNPSDGVPTGDTTMQGSVVGAMQFAKGTVTVHVACRDFSAIYRAKAQVPANITRDKIEILSAAKGTNPDNAEYTCTASTDKATLTYKLKTSRCLTVTDGADAMALTKIDNLGQLETAATPCLP